MYILLCDYFLSMQVDTASLNCVCAAGNIPAGHRLLSPALGLPDLVQNCINPV